MLAHVLRFPLQARVRVQRCLDARVHGDQFRGNLTLVVKATKELELVLAERKDQREALFGKIGSVKLPEDRAIVSPRVLLALVTEEQRSRTGWIACQMLVEILADGPSTIQESKCTEGDPGCRRLLNGNSWCLS